jgi:ABC-type multidrug transport system fused ATPase/permease subunit
MSDLGLINGFQVKDDPTSSPELSFGKMLRLALKTWPYMRPMLKHLLFMGVLLFAGSLGGLITLFVGTDLFSNKVLVGEKLQPIQAVVLFVGDEYVTDDPKRLKGKSVESGKKTGKAYSGKPGVNPAGKGSAVAQEMVEPELTPDQRKTVRNRLIIWGILGSVGTGVVFLLIPYYFMWVWQSINQNLRVDMLQRAESLSLRYHDNSRVGDVIFRVYQDSAMIMNLLQEGIVYPTLTIVWILMSILFVMAFDPLFAAMVIVISIPVAWVIFIFTPRIRLRAMNNRTANSDLTSRLQEAFAAVRIVKANCAETWVFDRFNRDSLRALDAAYFLRLDMIILTLVVGMLGGITLIFAEYIMVTFVVEERDTFLGAWAASFLGFAVWNLGAFEIARKRVGDLAGAGGFFVGVWSRMQDLFIALDRAFYLLELEPEVADPDEPVGFPTQIEEIVWRDLYFGYDDKHPVLQGIDLRARAGTVTAIVGATGAGKSTLMSMLLRLYDPDRGQLLVNGIELNRMAIADLRGNIAIALQKNVLFAGTVASNIGYSTPDAKREDIEAAARVACADEFIRTMANGYDTELGERGGKLSAGQRQRLSIARAVVRDTQILILDEPTASLDARTEHQVLANLSTWGRGKVIFLITHRLSTIRNADEIAFLEHGRIVEHGSHDDLMAREGGRYREFVDAEIAESEAGDEP